MKWIRLSIWIILISVGLILTNSVVLANSVVLGGVCQSDGECQQPSTSIYQVTCQYKQCKHYVPKLATCDSGLVWSLQCGIGGLCIQGFCVDFFNKGFISIVR